MTKTRFVALSVAAIDVPPSTNGAHPPIYHLAGMAMFVAERDGDGAWSFAVDCRALAAGQSEDVLLTWATHIMPDTGILLGWQLAEAIMPPLLDATTSGDPQTACAFIDRLVKLSAAPSVDLAGRYGGAGALPFGVVAASRGIPAELMSAAEIESAWAFGNVGLLQAHVERAAIATWRLWMAEANGGASAVSAAFADWLASRAARSQ